MVCTHQQRQHPRWYDKSPGWSWYLPMAHLLHKMPPLSSWYSPALHATHSVAAPEGCTWPTGHCSQTKVKPLLSRSRSEEVPGTKITQLEVPLKSQERNWNHLNWDTKSEEKPLYVRNDLIVCVETMGDFRATKRQQRQICLLFPRILLGVCHSPILDRIMCSLSSSIC